MKTNYTAAVRIQFQAGNVPDPDSELKDLAALFARCGSITKSQHRPYWKIRDTLEFVVELTIHGKWQSAFRTLLALIGDNWSVGETKYEGSATCSQKAGGVLRIPRAIWANVEVFPAAAAETK